MTRKMSVFASLVAAALLGWNNTGAVLPPGSVEVDDSTASRITGGQYNCPGTVTYSYECCIGNKVFKTDVYSVFSQLDHKPADIFPYCVSAADGCKYQQAVRCQ